MTEQEQVKTKRVLENIYFHLNNDEYPFSLNHSEYIGFIEVMNFFKIQHCFPDDIYPITIIQADVVSNFGKKWLQLSIEIDHDFYKMGGKITTLNIYLKDGHPDQEICLKHARIRKSLDNSLRKEKLTVENLVGSKCYCQIEDLDVKDFFYMDVKEKVNA